MDGVTSLESFKLFNIAFVDLVNTTVNQVEIIECTDVVLRESCFVEGLSVEKNSVVSLQDTFAGGVITCKDNQNIQGINPNTAYVQDSPRSSASAFPGSSNRHRELSIANQRG